MLSMRLSRLFPLAIAALTGCSRGATSPGERSSAPVPTSASVASAEPPRSCTPSEARCASVDEARACDAEGRKLTTTRCESGSVCSGGRCVSLALVGGGGALAREGLRRVVGEGWLDGWSIATAVPPKTWERVVASPADAFMADAGLSFSRVCAPEGYVTVPNAGEATAHVPARALAAGRLVAGRAEPALLEVGFAGGYRVYVNGELVASGERAARPRPFPDEADVPVTLREGVNDVVVATERTSAAPSGFWMRVLALDGRAMPGLFFAPATLDGVCPVGELVDVDVAPSPVHGGFSAQVSAKLRGLAPLGDEGLPFRVELAPGTSATRTLVEGTLALEDLERGTANPHVEVPLDQPGKHELAVTIAGAARSTSLVYHGALSDRIVALEGAVAQIPSSVPEASRASFERHVAMLVDDLREGVNDVSFLEARTTEGEKLASALAEGGDPYRAKKGVVYRGYRSPLDGRIQPYVAFVPPSYQPDGKPLPLVVVFHGMNRLPEHALRTLVGEAPDHTDRALALLEKHGKKPVTTSLGFSARHLPGFPDQRAILVAPWGYGNAGPRPIGEEDIVRVVDEMRAAYRIDDRRISMTGYSLGGTVAFVVPLHYPDRFSAAAPLCGYPNLATYHDVRSVPHQPWEDVLVAKRYIVNYADNGAHLPLRIVHGGLDGPARSAVVASRYRALGNPVHFDVQDDLDHDVWDYAYEDAKMIPWLAGRKRPDVPPRVHFVTGELRYHQSYWVRLDAMKDSRLPTPSAEGFASIDARWDQAKGEVTVATKNVKSFALDLAVLAPRPTHVTIDERALDLPDDGEWVHFEEEGSGFSRLDGEPSLAGRKRPGVAGPLDDWLRHPALVVYGTLDPAQVDANRRVAEHFASHGTYSSAHFPVKADVDVAEAELSQRSLVLIGNPASNRITAELAGALPVQFEPDAVVLRGTRYPGKNVGVSFIAPNPRDPAEYVVVHAGVSRRGTLASRHLPELAPDYLVYDDGIAVARGGLLLGDRKVLAGGFFDDTWR
jgi:predicted esterase